MKGDLNCPLGMKGGPAMQALAYKEKAKNRGSGGVEPIKTSLYGLISSIRDALGPGEEDLVVAVVLDLIRPGRAKWVRRHKSAEALQLF